MTQSIDIKDYLINVTVELESALGQAFARGATSLPDMVRNGVSVIVLALLQHIVSLQAPRPFDLRHSLS
jgi:hypothetical protein